MITDSILDSGYHKYAWCVNNTKTWTPGYRRFWICWKSNIDVNQLFETAYMDRE
jgi:hypothetical protein